MQIQNTLKVLCSALCILLLSQCDRRSCNDVVCGVNQGCSNGNCFCADGYEGSNCNIESYQKYVGTYQVYETCGGSSCNFCNYTSYITPDGFDVRRININNVLNQGGSLLAVIRTDQSNQGNFLEVATQNLGGITVSGQGYFDSANNRLRLELNYTYNFNSFQCTQMFYKQ
jgi:hypothetical protein